MAQKPNDLIILRGSADVTLDKVLTQIVFKSDVDLSQYRKLPKECQLPGLEEWVPKEEYFKYVSYRRNSPAFQSKK